MIDKAIKEVSLALVEAYKHDVAHDHSFRFEGMSQEYRVPDLCWQAYQIIKELEAAQTPRVLTLEEVRNGPLEIGWLEDFDKCDVIPGIRFRLVNEGGDEAVEFHVMDGFIAPRLAYYGELWRCWDKKPTNEQRLTTPWNKQLLQYADEDVLQGGLAPAT